MPHQASVGPSSAGSPPRSPTQPQPNSISHLIKQQEVLPPSPDVLPPPLPPSDRCDAAVLARPPNPFQRWLSLQVLDVAGELLPPSQYGLAEHVMCEVRSPEGLALEQFPLRHGGGGSSDRVDVLMPSECEWLVLLLRPPPSAAKAAHQSLGQARLHLGPLWAAEPTEGSSLFDAWLPVVGGSDAHAAARAHGRYRPPSEPAEGDDPELAQGALTSTPRSGHRRLLHLVARVFRPADLLSDRARVFSYYTRSRCGSSGGDDDSDAGATAHGGDAVSATDTAAALRRPEFDRMVLDLEASGTGLAAELAAARAAASTARSLGTARTGWFARCLCWCGLARPETSMFRYLGQYVEIAAFDL